MKTEEQLLQGMLDLLGDGAHWTRDALARNAWGVVVDPMNEHATSFCLAGAAFRSAGMGETEWHLVLSGLLSSPLIDGIMERLLRVTGLEGDCLDSRYGQWSRLAVWNNTRATYGEIQSALRAAMENGK